MEVVFFASGEAFRAWLEEWGASASEIWVGFHKKAVGADGVTYAQALDEALCFGWIDGLRKGVDATSFTIRFTPRKRRSIWSAVNIARAEELTRLGLMRPGGLAAFAAREEQRSRVYSFENAPATLSPDFAALFQSNAQAWAYFTAQAPSYQRAAIWWVMSAKQDATRQRRLAKLIEDAAAGRRLSHLTSTPKR